MNEKKLTTYITIGTLAKQANVSIETIRHYQRIGIIDVPPKPYSGFRKYNESTVFTLKFIKSVQKLGFSLKEIKKILNLNTESCPNIKSSFKKRINSIQKEISELITTKKILNELLNKCEEEHEITKLTIVESLRNINI